MSSNPKRRASDNEEQGASFCVSEKELEALLDKAADRGAKRALDTFYVHVGKGVVTKLTWFIGVALTGAYIWLKTKGLAE